MKIKITKFDPHQNAKVFAVMMALLSLIFLLPMMLFMAAAMPASTGFPGSVGVVMVLFVPIMYLITTYVGVAIGIFILNFVTKYTGGLEFEFEDGDA